MGVHFALRSGDDHLDLKANNLHFMTNSSGSRYLQYAETISKNYKDGLMDKELQPRVACAYANTLNPERCIVLLVEKYLSLCAKEALEKGFYLKPLSKKYKDNCWYSKAVMGHNTLSGMVKSIMSDGGMSDDGYYTNNSL